MKSNVTLKSSDRDLFGVTIRQNTQGQFLSITDLQKSYEVARWQYGWNEQNLASTMQGERFKERIYYLLKERQLVKIELSTFMDMVEKEGVTKVLKGLGVYKTTGKGVNKMVMADPYVWVLLAMELNPMIYAKVVIWLTDSLVFDRMEAGGEYLPMNTSIKTIVNEPNYISIAKTINERVFGHHQAGMRNIASAKELRKITDIEKFIINAIANKWIKTETDVINAIKNYA